jgi:NitT/TauT family transport system substrate-binding protein
MIFLVVVAIVLGATYYVGGLDFLLNKNQSNNGVQTPPNNTNNNNTGTPSNGEDVLNISLDEWIGWKPIIDANGGLTTKPGSIYDKLGLKLNINIINDAVQSSNALIQGSLDGAGYTINRYTFLYPKFKQNNTPVKMAYITNSSSGGDGIIAKQGINRIEDLVGKKIAVPRFSEAQTLVEWLMSKSSLSADQISTIRANMVMFETPDDAAKAFFAGKVDAAATWQPYLSQAQETTGAKLLFSTKSATNIILDGIVFRQDYLDNNKETVQKFVEGALMAMPLYKTEFNPIKNTMPLFATETNENIAMMTEDATLADYSSNVQLLNGISQTLFTDMSSIWASLGEEANAADVKDAFDASVIQSLSGKFTASTNKVQQFTQEQREAAKAQSNNEALLKQTLTINFDTNTSVIKPESYDELTKFADAAKLLNAVIIQIEGNTDNVGNVDANMKLSSDRAKSVATYLQYQGIDPSRFVIVGNGSSKPLSDNKTAEGKSKNRRTDIFFKVIQ